MIVPSSRRSTSTSGATKSRSTNGAVPGGSESVVPTIESSTFAVGSNLFGSKAMVKPINAPSTGCICKLRKIVCILRNATNNCTLRRTLSKLRFYFGLGTAPLIGRESEKALVSAIFHDFFGNYFAWHQMARTLRIKGCPKSRRQQRLDSAAAPWPSDPGAAAPHLGVRHPPDRLIFAIMVAIGAPRAHSRAAPVG